MDQAASGAIRETGSASERGPWSTGLALLLALAPVGFAVALGIAGDRNEDIGPLSTAQVLYWIGLPLAALYPTIAAVARRMAYAPTTVLMIASIAPALAFATRLVLDPLSSDGHRHGALTLVAVLQRAWPPAVLAVGTFVAIEIATAAIRRGVAVGFFGAVIAAVVFGAAFAVGLLPALMLAAPAS